TVSVGPPAAAGTTSVIGRVGKVLCADATFGAATAATANTASSSVRRQKRMDPPSVLMVHFFQEYPVFAGACKMRRCVFWTRPKTQRGKTATNNRGLASRAFACRQRG